MSKPRTPPIVVWIALLVLLVVGILVLILHQTSSRPVTVTSATPYTHLEHHVLLMVDAATQEPLLTVVFHSNGMALVRELHLRHRIPMQMTHPEEEEEEGNGEEEGEGEGDDEDQPHHISSAAWSPCTYTWQSSQQILRVVSPFAPSLEVSPWFAHLRHITFTDAVTLPEQGLEGYAVTVPPFPPDTTPTFTHYLWKVQPTTSPALVGKRLRFQRPVVPSLVTRAPTQIPFDELEMLSTTHVRATFTTSTTSTTSATSTTIHPMSYRPSLPRTSRWSCALYIRGRSEMDTSHPTTNAAQPTVTATWKMATVRLHTGVQRADIQWRDMGNLFHTVSGIAYEVVGGNGPIETRPQDDSSE